MKTYFAIHCNDYFQIRKVIKQKLKKKHSTNRNCLKNLKIDL